MPEFFDPLDVSGLPQTSLEFYKSLADAAPSDPTFVMRPMRKYAITMYRASLFLFAKKRLTPTNQCLF
jgi:hypothetical protein